MSFGISEMIQKKAGEELQEGHTGKSSQGRKNKLAHRDSENTIVWGFSGNSNGSVGFPRSVVESLMGEDEKEMQGEREVEGKQAYLPEISWSESDSEAVRYQKGCLR